MKTRTLKELFEEDKDFYSKLLELSASEDLTDTALGHPQMIAYGLLAFKVQDLANLQLVTHNMPNVRNHGVAIRRLINREAKRIREGGSGS